MDIAALRARLGALVLPSILLVAGSSSALAQQQTPTTYDSSFSIASQRVDPQGHTVIIMQGTGDLPGVLTLVLSLASDGTVASGEWALNVSYTAPLNPGAPPKPDSPDPDSGVGEQLIQKGTLSGTIAGGSTVATNGQITEFTFSSWRLRPERYSLPESLRETALRMAPISTTGLTRTLPLR